MSALPDSLLIGFPSVDQEHQALFDHLNTLHRCSGEILEPSEFAETLSRLSAQLIEHFNNEEAFMRTIGVPDAEFAPHADAHTHIVEQLAELSFDLMKRKHISRDQVLGKVGAWIVDHLSEYDLKLRKFR